MERYVRGKWVCASCETLVQAPVAAHVIDKGIPTCGLMAHVLIAKFIDHLPLYRQEKIFGRAGLAIPQSTLADWVGTCGVQLQAPVDALREELLTHRVLHADETPVAMLKPGKGKTHRAYIWSYCTMSFDAVKAVVFDFAESRAGEHARDFLGIDTEVAGSGWHGTLVCDDYSGYKAAFAHGLVEAGWGRDPLESSRWIGGRVARRWPAAARGHLPEPETELTAQRVFVACLRWVAILVELALECDGVQE